MRAKQPAFVPLARPWGPSFLRSILAVAIYLGQAVPEGSAGGTFPGRPYVLTFQQLAIAFE